MGYFLRYADTVGEAKKALDSGELGQLTLVRCHAAMPHRAWDLQGSWFADPTNITSIFQEDACHVVDIMLYLLGMPNALTAMRITGNFDPTVGEDAIAAVFDYGTHLATIDFNAHEANPWIDTWSFELYGTTGSLRIGLAPEWIERYRADSGWIAEGEQRLTGPSDGHARDASSRHQYARALAGLIQAIEGTAPAPVDVAAGLQVMRVVEAIQQSADTGLVVKFAEAAVHGA
jgi:predicted dehydrogenase